MKEQISNPNFLEYLKDIASSPLAFVGYIIVIIFWSFFVWLNYKRNVIEAFTEEKKKIIALESLLDTKPPKGADPIKWLALKLKGKIHSYLFFSFLSTLLTAIILFTIATFNSTSKEKGSSPSQIDSLSTGTTINSNNNSSNNDNRSSLNVKTNTDDSSKSDR